MQVLVTGVAGFIGSHLAEELIAAGHSVVGLDCFTDYYPRIIKERNLQALLGRKEFCFVEGDLLELELGGLLRRGPAACPPLGHGSGNVEREIDYVFHLAAQPGVRGSWGKSFEVYARNNILATQRLLEAVKEEPVQKLVYASSSSVYGDAEAFPTGEDVTPRPVSPYGVTKLSAEQLCLLYWRNWQVPAVCTRYFTVYGPRQRPDMAFHRFVRAGLKGEEIQVYGDGEQTRDFTFVDDAVKATMSAAFGGAPGRVFNVGGGSRVTLNHVIQVLDHILGRSLRVQHMQAQRGDVRDTSADIRRARRELAYDPSISLEEGLRAQVEWVESLLQALEAA